MRKHGTSGSSLPISDSPTSQAIHSAAPVNGAPSTDQADGAGATRPTPTKPKQLAVAIVLAPIPPTGITGLVLTAVNPEQKILGVPDPYLEELHAQLEPVVPWLVSLEKLAAIRALVAGDVADHVADAAQLARLFLGRWRDKSDQDVGPTDVENALVAIDARLTAALEILQTGSAVRAEPMRPQLVVGPGDAL